MTSKSLWMSVAVAPQAIPLQGDEQCDVAVIGGGIAGLSTAYELSQLGRSVVVVDRGPIAGGMTARSSAHLAPLCDDLMSEMQKIKGADLAKTFLSKPGGGRRPHRGDLRRRKVSSAISGGWMAIFSRATICRRM